MAVDLTNAKYHDITSLSQITGETKVLVEGSLRSENVIKQVQELLKKAGFSQTINGTFNGTMTGYVKQFQAQLGLMNDGIVGKETLTILQNLIKQYDNPVITQNTAGLKYTNNNTPNADVKTLQQNLIDVGMNYQNLLKADGVYGQHTVKKVMHFQKIHSMTPIDGTAGANVNAKLTALLALKREDPVSFPYGHPLGVTPSSKKTTMAEKEAVARCLHGECRDDEAEMKAVLQVMFNRKGGMADYKEVVCKIGAFHAMSGMTMSFGNAAQPDRTTAMWK